ncbi:MAG: amidohydrolase [Actinomycetota bacterium]
MLIRNARVYTVDPKMPWAEAVAITGDRITWVGRDSDAEEHRGGDSAEIDGGGRLLLPGVVDSHNHVRLGGDPEAVHLAGASTLDEVHIRISAWLDGHPDAEWIECEGLYYEAIPDGRMPEARDLDPVARGLPLIAYTYDAHNAILNTEGLARFGITRETERVPFGMVIKDPETDEPTGRIGDFAVMGLERAGEAALAGVLPGYSPDRLYERLVRSLDMAVEFGITTVVEPQNSLDDLSVFERARDEGTLRSRLVAALFHPPGTTDAELDEFAEAARSYDDDWLRVGPLKLYIDDVIEPHTAAFFEPYSTEPKTTGDSFYKAGEFRDLMVKLDGRGFQTFTHSMGDRGIRMVLDAHEAARKTNGPRDARHQLVHVECPHPSDVPRFAELGLVACVQPRHWAPDIAGEWRAAVGEEREAWAAPFKRLNETGAVLAFSSDWNVAEMDPLIGMYSAITRADLEGRDAWGTAQTVDIETAVRAYTMGGAYANFCDSNRGSITAGKYADLIVLSQNLFEMPPAGILETEVDLTMVGGEIRHPR